MKAEEMKKNKESEDEIKRSEKVVDELIVDTKVENMTFIDDKYVSKKKFDRNAKIFGCICVGVFITAFGFFGGHKSIDRSDYASKALTDKVSTALEAGAILSLTDSNVEKKDYIVEHKSEAKETKIWVWDYAAEDGDYVQILVDGTPISDAFMIKNKPKEFTIPALGEVQVKGIKDGGGGITYAIKYEINGISYFNGTSQGEYNKYTLTKNN